MADNLVIVESPAKAKMITRFLGDKYLVRASMGHVRDLPKKKTGVNVSKNFEPEYEVSEDKKKVIADLRKELKKNPKVWIATDEDREGEAIGWHLCEALGVDEKQVDRIVFHEITKGAILEALEHPRKINKKLVDAQQARRVLDRLVGYELSPLLWKKVRRGLSAGRVQSVAVRLVVEREREIREFNAEEYWKIEAEFKRPELKAELHKIDGKAVRPKGKPALVNNKDEAARVVGALEESEYKVTEVVKKDGVKTPAPPFTTSTLQQEASRKLGYTVKQTMVLAQMLYEGSEVNVPKHEGGLITYMRTDSVNLAKQALTQAKQVISGKYGKEYALETPRFYKSKAKGAQEAHEAIRPVDISLVPDEIKPYVKDAKCWKLYKLIWERAVACQMAQAKVERTTVRIGAEAVGVGKCEFEVKGEVVKFAGFLKVYAEGKDEGEEDVSFAEELLPVVEEGEKCDLKELFKEQNFTSPPPRYTEASLVKKLESEGIGRPSTYAPTISTVQTRGYVEKNAEKKLEPTEMGELVNDFLVEHFPQVVDYGFTAKVEEEFDKIAEGEEKWNEMIGGFYGGFHETVKEKDETVSRADVAQARELGIDPESGKPVSVRLGPFGPFAQIGTKDDDEKPKFASLPKGVSTKEITLAEALKLFTLPRKLGKDKDGNEVEVNRGRFGPYVKVDGKYYSLKEDDPLEVGLERALQVVEAERERKAKMVLQNYPEEDIQVLDGRFGAYVKKGKTNYKLTKEEKEKAKELTLDELKAVVERGPAKKFTPRRGRKK